MNLQGNRLSGGTQPMIRFGLTLALAAAASIPAPPAYLSPVSLVQAAPGRLLDHRDTLAVAIP